MQNVKDKIYEAIKDVTENVTDQYPKNWATLPAIQYCEEDNKVLQWLIIKSRVHMSDTE